MNRNKSTDNTNAASQSKTPDKGQKVDEQNRMPSLIWYDKNDNENKQDHTFVCYTNAQQCIEAIQQSTVPIYLILAAACATDILSRVHLLTQIDMIFIFCKSSREQQRCQYLLQHYSKIFDLFYDRQHLLDAIRESTTLHQRQSGNEYLRLAELYREKNDLNRALKYTHKALDTYRQTLPTQDHPLIARCLNNLGGIYDIQGDVNRSFEYYEQAVKIYSHFKPSGPRQ